MRVESTAGRPQAINWWSCIRDPGLVRGDRGGRAGWRRWGRFWRGTWCERRFILIGVLLHGRLHVRAARGRVPGGASGAGLHRRGRDSADVRHHADAEHPGGRPDQHARCLEVAGTGGRAAACSWCWPTGSAIGKAARQSEIVGDDRAAAADSRRYKPRGLPTALRRSTTWPRSSATS